MWRIPKSGPPESRIRLLGEKWGSPFLKRALGTKPEVSSEVVIQMPGETNRFLR
jgi:hypothetical protein